VEETFVEGHLVVHVDGCRHAVLGHVPIPISKVQKVSLQVQLLILTKLIFHRFCDFGHIRDHSASKNIHCVLLDRNHIIRSELLSRVYSLSDHLVDSDTPTS